jgi:hypothetical protein
MACPELAARRALRQRIGDYLDGQVPTAIFPVIPGRHWRRCLQTDELRSVPRMLLLNTRTVTVPTGRQHASSHPAPLHTEGFIHFVTSMTAPIATGWCACRVGLSFTGNMPPLHDACRSSPFDLFHQCYLREGISPATSSRSPPKKQRRPKPPFSKCCSWSIVHFFSIAENSPCRSFAVVCCSFDHTLYKSM